MTPPIALPTPIPIAAGVCNLTLTMKEGLGEVVALTDVELNVFEWLGELMLPTDVPIDESEVGGLVDELMGAVVVTSRVLTKPPLLVVRDRELVRAGVEALVADELGAAVDEVGAGGVSVASAHAEENPGKHDETPYAWPSCMIFSRGEPTAVNASVAEVWGQVQSSPLVIVGPLSLQAYQSVDT